MKIRVAAVSFMNAAPLWWAMKDHPAVELLLMPPAETARCLMGGGADLAIVPTFEAVRNDLPVAAPFGVLSNGDVRSVLLFHPGDIGHVGKIFLDPASRTSQAMMRHLFSDRGIIFETGRRELNDLAPDEAQLLIGDDALKLYSDPMPKLDIATMWKERTGRSALFALWVGKNESPGSNEAELIGSSLRKGLAALDEIIAWAVSKTGLGEPLLRHYFEKSLFYEFGAEGEKARAFCQDIFRQ